MDGLADFSSTLGVDSGEDEELGELGGVFAGFEDVGEADDFGFAADEGEVEDVGEGIGVGSSGEFVVVEEEAEHTRVVDGDGGSDDEAEGVGGDSELGFVLSRGGEELGFDGDEGSSDPWVGEVGEGACAVDDGDLDF